MKKNLMKLLLAMVLTIAISEGSYSQRIYVKVQPTAPVVVRPAAPGAGQIWIDGEWVVTGGKYVYKPGYWTVAPVRSAWVPGHWARRRFGWYWVPGHWRRI